MPTNALSETAAKQLIGMHLIPRLKKLLKCIPGEGTATSQPAGIEQDTRGQAFFLAGQWDKAVLELQRAVSVNPWNPIFKFHLIRAYLAKQQTDLAEPLAESLIAQAPSLPEAALAIALVRERRGERLQAQVWYNRFLTMNLDVTLKKEAEKILA